MGGRLRTPASDPAPNWQVYGPTNFARPMSATSGPLLTVPRIHVKGKGGKERSAPIEAELLSVIEAYLDSRATRFPAATKREASVPCSALSRWSARSALFVGRDGERITRRTVQSRIKRAFKRDGPDAQPVPGAMVHGLRHTYATELASSDVSVYSLMKLLGHESMSTSQRYVTAAGTETRSAAAQNRLYALIPVADTKDNDSPSSDGL
jgi:integrase/recombinase XerC